MTRQLTIEEKELFRSETLRFAKENHLEVTEISVDDDGFVMADFLYEPVLGQADDFSECYMPLLANGDFSLNGVENFLDHNGYFLKWYELLEVLPLYKLRNSLMEVIPWLEDDEAGDLISYEGMEYKLATQALVKCIKQDLENYLSDGNDGLLNLELVSQSPELCSLLGRVAVDKLIVYSSWRDSRLLSSSDNETRIGAVFCENNLAYGREIIKQARRYLGYCDDVELDREDISRFIHEAYSEDLDQLFVEDEFLFLRYLYHQAVVYMDNGMIVAY